MKQNMDDLFEPYEREAVDAFIERIFDKYSSQIETVILFGSKVRGDHYATSDFDILLVTDTDDWHLKHAISSIAADIGLEHNVLIDARVIERGRWQRMKQEGFSLYENVSRDGIQIEPVTT